MKYVWLLGSTLCMGLGAHAIKQVVVSPEDTVYSIAYKEGVRTQAVISANNLQPPYALAPGQTLTIPGPGEHILSAGESLKDVADFYGVNVDALVEANDVGALKPGSSLVIPSANTKSMTEVFRAPAPAITETSLAPLPSATVPVASTAGVGGAAAPLAAPAVMSGGLPSDIADELAREEKAPSQPLVGDLTKKNEGAPTGDPALAKEEKKEEKKKAPEKKEEKPKEVAFIWPVQGTVIKEFTAGSNDGINIQVEEGTPIKAAAKGEVIYVGNEIKNLGNLVLVKHEGGYVTAYSHLSEALVKKGDSVKQGGTVGNAGATGEISSPQLHFEIREGKKPINPIIKLKSAE